MNYCDPQKIHLQLKLGRPIYQFIKIGEYFERKTFEYVSLSKSGQGYLVKLVQVLNYVYSVVPSMDEFETVEELDEECGLYYTGSLEDCFSWAHSHFEIANDKWTLDIIDIYKEFVAKDILG